MLIARDYRHSAWEALRGNWGTAIVTYLVYSVIIGVCGALSAIGVGAILVFVLEGPLQYGLTVQSMNIARGESIAIDNLFVAKDRFTEVFLAYLINSIYIALWSLLFIIPGIIQAYSYSMTFYLMRDNPNLKPDEARRESDKLMNGHKWELFCLHLSFIGWILLCVITCGILVLWVVPYMQCATAEFYETLIPPRAKVEHVSTSSDDDVESPRSDVTNRTDSDEPFYVFEEERPRETTVLGDSINPNKKPPNGDK